MLEKVQQLLAKLDEIEFELGQSEVLKDQKKFRALTQEHSRLSRLRSVYNDYSAASNQLEESRQLLTTEADLDMISLLKDEIASLQVKIETSLSEIESLLVPPDPRDSRNIIMELRAGTGGDEAALFVGDCIRMYRNYAVTKGWKVEVLSATESDMGGYKEYIMSVTGENVFRFLQYEAGTHRVQRVPATEAQGRVHTSAITVAVLLEPSDDDDIKIDEKDLKIDTYRSSGAGGQHVNVTDSAVRITHLPTGTVVACQDERSQHKNKDKAMRMLKARISEELSRKAAEEQASIRSSQVGSGDRSEKSRTYNFPQNRLTDHRIDLSLYTLDRILNGDLDQIVVPLVQYFYQQKLQA